MRTGLKVFLILAILGVLAYGLLGPVLAAGHLHDEARTAAQAGFNQLEIVNAGGSSASVQAAVTASLARHPNVHVKSVVVNDGQVTVVVDEKVHSFMNGFPGLKGWFTVNATESASAFGS